MRSIVVPKLNNNDDSCVLLEWRRPEGSEIEVDTPLALLETSKATVELLADAKGILHRTGEAGESYPFGATIGQIFENESDRTQHLTKAPVSAAPSGGPEITVTQAARALMERHGVTEQQLRSLGKSVIKTSDVEGLIQPAAAAPAAAPAPAPTSPQQRRQAMIAKVVSQSHATIPSAFNVMRIICEETLGYLERYQREQNTFVGLPDFLVATVAGLAETFPQFFTTAAEAGSDPSIGVTIDVGRGLFIPVIKQARSKSLAQISDTLRGYRMKAVRDTFKGEDLEGGQISISLNVDPDLVFTIPIILPGQVCMLSLGAVLRETVLTDDGRPISRRYVHLGAAYDHRALNGSDANQFLKAIKKVFEGPPTT